MTPSQKISAGHTTSPKPPRADTGTASEHSIAQSFTTKELTFDRAYGHELTVDKLCVGAVCVTEDQFMAVFGASALSQTASASASAPTSASASTAANDNQETTATPDAIEPAPAEPAVVEDQPAEPAPLPEVQAANDNAPATIIPASDNPPPAEAPSTTQAANL